MNQSHLDQIKKGIENYKKDPNDPFNASNFAEYASEVMPILIAEIERLRAKVNRLAEHLDSEGVYQAPDRSDYLIDRED